MENFDLNTHGTIKGLSIKQPFAELIMQDKVETRTWSTNYRGWVLICASGKAYTLSKVKQLSVKNYSEIHQTLFKGDDLTAFEQVGMAIGIAYLHKVERITYTELATALDAKTYIDEDILVETYPLFLHHFKDAKRINPFKLKGGMKYFTLSTRFINKIEIL
jgi:hypothetical protein